MLALALGAPAFVGVTLASTVRADQAATVVFAEKQSVALVKVTEENSITTASVIGATAGLLLGGVWLGGALFAATAYLARKKDDDLALGLKGIASGGLEALNFVGYLNEKYTVTDKLGSAISEAVDNLKKEPQNKETVTSVTGALDTIKGAIDAFDKDVSIKDTLGSILTAGGELAAQAVD